MNTITDLSGKALINKILPLTDEWMYFAGYAEPAVQAEELTQIVGKFIKLKNVVKMSVTL